MQAIYRKAVRHISRRYEESALYRIGLLLCALALFWLLMGPLLYVLGPGIAGAVAMVVLLVGYATALAFIIVPGDWVNED